MSPLETKAMASRVVREAMSQMTVACPDMQAGDGAYQIMREAALQLKTFRGQIKSATALHALASEIASAP